MPRAVPRITVPGKPGVATSVNRFGVEPPAYPALDLPASALTDTLLLPFAVAAELGVVLGVSGGY